VLTGSVVRVRVPVTLIALSSGAVVANDAGEHDADEIGRRR